MRQQYNNSVSLTIYKMFKPKHSHLDASAKDEIERKRQLINRIKVSTFSYRPITDKNCLSRTKK